MDQNTRWPHPPGGPPRAPAAGTGKRKPKENLTWWPSWLSSCPGTPKDLPGTARDRPGTAQGPLGSAQGAPGTAQGAPGTAQGAPRDRPRSAQAQPTGHLKRLRPPWKLSRSSPRAAHRLPGPGKTASASLHSTYDPYSMFEKATEHTVESASDPCSMIRPVAAAAKRN